MLVSIERPYSTAVMLDPLPRWQVMSFNSVIGLPKWFAASCATYWVRQSVKPVLADSVLLVKLARDSVQKRLFRNGVVERGVEHRHLRHPGKNGLARRDTHQRGRIVQGAPAVRTPESRRRLHRR